jgi:hypothetical protein
MPRPLRPTRIMLPRWFDPFTGDLKAARARFKQDFGFAHDDKQQVDAEIVRLFRNHSRKRDDTVPIPAGIVLAVMLRAGFARGRGRQQMRRDERARIVDAVPATQARMPYYLQRTHRRHYSYERAKLEAAADVERQLGVPAAVILRKENWISRRRSRAST